MMQIFVNGKPQAVAPNATLADLVTQLGFEESACATAINQQFVARSQRQHTPLKENDQIMTFEPITGG
jgi:sulfur carrier protein